MLLTALVEKEKRKEKVGEGKEKTILVTCPGELQWL